MRAWPVAADQRGGALSELLRSRLQQARARTQAETHRTAHVRAGMWLSDCGRGQVEEIAQECTGGCDRPRQSSVRGPGSSSPFGPSSEARCCRSCSNAFRPPGASFFASSTASWCCLGCRHRAAAALSCCPVMLVEPWRLSAVPAAARIEST